MHICGASCHVRKPDLAETGILQELLLENKSRNHNFSFPLWDVVLWSKIKEQENLDFYLNTVMDEVIMDGNFIKAVICRQASTEFIYEFYGKVFIDATVNAKIEVSPEAPPTLEEFLTLMENYPHVLLNIELKDYPEDGEEFAFQSADKICQMLIEHKVADRTWINSFSGKLLEFVYENYGHKFYYHGFYPWFILGEMKTDPESFIDVACMQHRVQHADGTIEKCADNMCPKEWFDYLLSKEIMPLMAPSLKEYPLYDKAFSYGSQIVNSDEPEKMLVHLGRKSMNR